MKKVITVEEVKKLAKENYTKGGDVICECFEDKQIEEYINGKEEFYLKPHTTKDSWMKLFKFYKDMEEEEQGNMHNCW